LRAVAGTAAFRTAALLALALIWLWPLLQSARYGSGAIRDSHKREMVTRFAPDLGDGVRGLGELEGLIIAGEPWLRWPAIAAALLLPFAVRRPASVVVPSILALYVGALLLAGGNVYARYTLTVLPILTAALAIVLVRMRPTPWTGIFAGCLLAGLSGGPVQPGPVRAAGLQPGETSAQIAALRTIGSEIGEDETLVYCHLSGAVPLIPGAISVYASNGQKIVSTRALRRWAERGGTGPLRGICPASDMADVEDLVQGLEIVREEAGYVVWTATGVR
jgi:hypothetical protein